MASRKIVIADESLTVQKIIKLALASEGHEILTAGNGSEALDLVQKERPSIVLVDFSLPHLDAFSLKAKLDQLGASAGIAWVLMQRADDHIDPSQFEQLGFSAKIVKPFDIEPSRLKPILNALPHSTPKPPPPRPPAPPKVSAATVAPPPPPVASSPTAPPMSGLPGFQLSKNSSPEGEDIRQLTEATVRETGLDQFGWSINEPGKSPVSIRENEPPKFEGSMGESEPQLRPPSRIFDLGPTVQEEEPSLGDWEDEPTIPPPPIPASAPTFSPMPPIEPPTPPTLNSLPELPISSPPSYEPLEFEPTFSAIPATGFEPSGAASISDERIEEIVREKVEDALGIAIRKMVPDLAERMIKEEIHKILMNPPV